MNTWQRSFFLGALVGGGVIAIAAMYWSEEPAHIKANMTPSEHLMGEIHAIQEQLAVLVRSEGTTPTDDGSPAQQPITRNPVDRISDYMSLLTHIAANIDDLKRQLATLHTRLGIGSEILMKAAQREPDRMIVQQIWDELKGGNQDQVNARWAMRSLEEVVTRLGRPDTVGSTSGRITVLNYKVGPNRGLGFIIGDGVVTRVSK